MAIFYTRWEVGLLVTRSNNTSPYPHSPFHIPHSPFRVLKTVVKFTAKGEFNKLTLCMHVYLISHTLNFAPFLISGIFKRKLENCSEIVSGFPLLIWYRILIWNLLFNLKNHSRQWLAGQLVCLRYSCCYESIYTVYTSCHIKQFAFEFELKWL